MAEYSKEYCEKYMPEYPYSFSIQEKFQSLNLNYCMDEICEGYGFYAIANEDGKCFLIFDVDGEDYYRFVPLENLDEYHKNKSLPHLYHQYI